MTISDFTEMLTVVHAATADSLAEQADQITQGARERDLQVIPARLDPDRVVEIDSTQLTADQVLVIAADVDAHLLYLHRVVLEQDEVNTALDDIDDDAERTRARKALARITGWTSRVEVGFAHRGVLHVWEKVTPWHDALDEFTTPSRRLSHWDSEPRDHGDFDEEKIKEIAGQIATSPEYRRARWATRRSIAEQLPALAELRKDPDKGSWIISSVIHQADELVRELAAERTEALQARRDELVTELAANSEFAAIRTADARLKFTQAWIRDTHSDGLPVENWWLKELAALAVQARKTNGSLQLTF